MSILHELGEKAVWMEYLDYRKEKLHISRKELKMLEQFVEEEKYREITDRITSADFEFSVPRKAFVNKKHTEKKRVIYLFSEEERMILQLMNHLLVKHYDHMLSPVCYSFRPGRSVKTAIRDIHRIPGLKGKYTVKLDLSSYFLSIPVEKMILTLERFLEDDPLLVDFLKRYLRRGMCVYNDEILTEPMGVITGTATAGFFGNLYLREVDEYFRKLRLPYFRYSDDIILFLNSREEQEQYLQLISHMLVDELGLQLNPGKIAFTAPGETWEYLGISSTGTGYDLSENVIAKTKGRIRRYARKLYRKQRSQRGVSYEKVVSWFLNRFNAIFFDSNEENEFAWNRWYFSVITTSESLREIDAYMQQYIRFLYTGRHCKENYTITYEKLKEMGYRSLVHEYYLYLENPEVYQQKNAEAADASCDP